MIYVKDFDYAPADSEAEKASNSYLMSLLAIMVGLPLPIINLLATWIFYMGNRRSTYFVRWHCTQALLSQLSLLIFNSIAFWWTYSVLFENTEVTNGFIAYVLLVVTLNLIEFIMTMITAVKVRKMVHVEWVFYGNVTNLFCKK